MARNIATHLSVAPSPNTHPVTGGPGQAARHAPNLREQLGHSGVKELSDSEVLALVLGTGDSTRGVEALARELLAQLGSLERLLSAGYEELLQVKGIGPAKAARLAAALELQRRREIRSMRQLDTLSSHHDVGRWASPRLAHLEHEEVWLLSLDARNRLRHCERVAQGGSHGCSLKPSDVLRPAVRNGAAAIVLVHNHPSGDARPSVEDLEMTHRLAQASDLIGIPLLDHVVVGGSEVSSIAEHL